MTKDIYSARRSTMAKCPSLKADKLKEEANDLYKARQRLEDGLIQAYENKKLKSKNMIKRAEALIAQRNEEKSKNSTS